ncbi:glycosyltransferase [Alteraurantiacibacter buctensis]|uniref:Glycosyltransferase n=1 Tax=Alteraurantiacibacter buctensis TaxID=1503981 RepID=A0A844Z357_9SPHN|nr:glycosyltransferase [Alteraurantiacibacter buctensis]
MTASANLLSVVIPNHNYGRFVGAAIASLDAQTHRPIEVIVVDDASTDDSVAQIEQALAGAKNLAGTKFLALAENVGKLGALNRALEHVKGHYFIILDSDDVLKPEYVERTIVELEKARTEDPSIAFLYTDCMLINAAGEELDRGKSAAWDPALLERYSFVPEPALCLAAPVLEAAPYDEAIRKGTKHHKWKKIVANGWNGRHLAEPLFCYRMHDANLSGIGKRVTAEVESGIGGERILSGYWPLQTTER